MHIIFQTNRCFLGRNSSLVYSTLTMSGQDEKLHVFEFGLARIRQSSRQVSLILQSHTQEERDKNLVVARIKASTTA